MPSRDLPPHVKSIVTEIETEIGEEGAEGTDPVFAAALAPAAAIEGEGAGGDEGCEGDSTCVHGLSPAERMGSVADAGWRRPVPGAGS